MAQMKYNAMLESQMAPRSTSGIWVEDSVSNPEWLVIYAGRRMEEGRTFRDGFEVRNFSLF
jgi:hypothetical protein